MLLPSAVKIIMDKISKRSKGYAFIEYTTEEAASVALKEMNGKVKLNMNVIEKEGETLDSDVIGCFSIAQIINGWMIVVDVAKTKPFRHNRRETSFEL